MLFFAFLLSAAKIIAPYLKRDRAINTQLQYRPFQIFISPNNEENPTENVKSQPDLPKVKYAEFDPELQQQRVEFYQGPINGTFYLYPWKAICDERDDGLRKSVIIFVLSWFSLKENVREIVDITTCSFYSSAGFAFDKNSRDFKIFTDNMLSGMLIIYPFDRNLTCPSYISIEIRDTPVTNYVPIERQLRRHEQSDPVDSEFYICTPVITNNISGNCFIVTVSLRQRTMLSSMN